MDDIDQEQPGEVAALRELVRHPGWLLFRESAAKTWGPEGYGLQMRAALKTIEAGPDRAYELARVAEQVEATAKAVDAIISWPTEQIQRLTSKAEPTGIGRWRRTHR